MKTPVTDVTGIGPHTAKLLNEHGFSSAESLAATTTEKLSEVPGFGPLRAQRVIDAAKDVIPPTTKPSKPESKSKDVTPPKKKSKKKKAKKNKKQKNDKKKQAEKPSKKDKKKKGKKKKNKKQKKK